MIGRVQRQYGVQVNIVELSMPSIPLGLTCQCSTLRIGDQLKSTRWQRRVVPTSSAQKELNLSWRLGQSAKTTRKRFNFMLNIANHRRDVYQYFAKIAINHECSSVLKTTTRTANILYCDVKRRNETQQNNRQPSWFKYGLTNANER
jgi:hypothetical protein